MSLPQLEQDDLTDFFEVIVNLEKPKDKHGKCTRLRTSPVLQQKRRTSVYLPGTPKPNECYSGRYASPYRLLQTLLISPGRLRGIGFCKPDTPRTPATRIHGSGYNYGTSHLSATTPESLNIDMLPFTTPLLINTLDKLQEEAQMQNPTQEFPDLLQIIDEDCCMMTTVTCVKNKSPYNMDIDDENVVEFLLNNTKENTVTENCQIKAKLKSPPRVRRNYRRAKPMSAQERENIQRIQKERRKQKRKEHFQQPSNGVRKSKRLRKPVHLFQMDDK